MAPEHPAGALEDEGLRGVKCSDISGTTCIFVKTCRKHGLASFKMVVGVLQKALGFRRHRSRPSRRISCIRGERSRYAPAGRFGIEVSARLINEANTQVGQPVEFGPTVRGAIHAI
jgi:hypothetical protein